MFLSTGFTSLDVAIGALALHLVLRLISYSRRIPKGLRLPPGPPGKFISGNANDMPVHQEWKIYDKWTKKYGDIFHVKVYGKSMVFVNSVQVAQDLFEKRSAIYSDKFEFPMLIDLMGWDFNLGLMRYGERWRRHRRLFQQMFHSKAVSAYHPIHVKQTKTLLRNFYTSPDKFTDHLRFLAGATIIEIVYGIKTLPTGDPYIATAERALAAMGEAGNPGSFLVDTIPLLKYVPEWMPGAGFQKKARIWRQPTVEMSVAPFTAVKKAMEDGTASASITVSLLEELSNKPDAPSDEEEVIRNVGAVAYAAGSDTTVVALITFMLAMVLYPDVQRKAQAELDSVIGMDRLPQFEDRASLPYVSAVCKEVYRWNPVFPLGVAHRSMQDDVYGDYFIPGGSVIIENAWSILHDEKVYGPKTREFNPERFFQSGIKDPVAHFGYGRRVCAGRHMAENSIWMAVVSILKAFDISPAKNKNGEQIVVGPNFTSGFISRPEPFQCSIQPRSALAASLVLDTNDN